MICPNRKVNETSISSRKEAFQRSPLKKETGKPYFYTAKRGLCPLIKQDISKLAGHGHDLLDIQGRVSYTSRTQKFLSGNGIEIP